MSSAKSVAVVVLACFAVAACESDERMAAVGRPAPDYSAVSIDGDSVSLAAHRGQVVLLNVWATWCHPCRDELPVLQKLHEKYASQGLNLVGVSVDASGKEGRVREFARSFGITYPIWLDPDEGVAHTFLAVGVPATFLIGRDGTLLWRHVGPIRENDPRLMPVLVAALTG